MDTEPEEALMLVEHGLARDSDPCVRCEPFQALLEFRGDDVHFSTTRLAFSFAVFHLWERVSLSVRPLGLEGELDLGL